MDTRYYSCKPFVDRHGVAHKTRFWKADFIGKQYVMGSLRRFLFKNHEGNVIPDEVEDFPSLADLFKDE